jgi:hypothetical protein
MKNQSVEEQLIEAVNNLTIQSKRNEEHISNLERLLTTSRREEEKPVEAHQEDPPPPVANRNLSTQIKVEAESRRTDGKAYDRFGNEIRIGSTVRWLTPSLFRTTGGKVVKISKTTVTAFDKKRKRKTWKHHHNCKVIE